MRADGQDRDGECSGTAGWDEIDKTVQHCLSGVEAAVHWCSEIPLFIRNRKMLTGSGTLVLLHHSVHKESHDVSNKNYTGVPAPPC